MPLRTGPPDRGGQTGIPCLLGVDVPAIRDGEVCADARLPMRLDRGVLGDQFYLDLIRGTLSLWERALERRVSGERSTYTPQAGQDREDTEPAVRQGLPSRFMPASVQSLIRFASVIGIFASVGT